MTQSPLEKRTLAQFRIMIVEDVESIQMAIYDYLRTDFTVAALASAELALEQIKTARANGEDFDLLITDIHLPGRSGIDLVEEVRLHFPLMKIALITSYDINNYIDYIEKHQIDQVISKHSRLSLRDIKIMAEKMLTGEIFGVQRYFPDIKTYYPTEMKNDLQPGNKEVFSVYIRSSDERIYWTDKISEILDDLKGVPESLSKLVLDEITTNAMVRAPKFADGSYKYQKQVPNSDILIPFDRIHLAEEDYFIVQYGYYDDWIIFTCIDPQGTLEKEEILRRLKRHVWIDEKSGLPEGLADTHGRGIFLLREQLTHLIFNIEKNKRTEVICLFNQRHDMPYKNISIYQTPIIKHKGNQHDPA